MLSENIAALRKKQGMSQQSLADAVFVTRQTISKWEKNLSVPDADALLRLADALDTTVQSLLGQPEETQTPPPSDIAAALSRINDQLAIQNRRRARVWKVILWVIGVLAAMQLMLLVLGYAGYARTREVETSVVTVEESVMVAE